MRSVIDLDDDNPDREVTLGMTSLLGIFFGLVLVCGIFFGFGYSMGRRGSSSSASTPAATPASTPAPAATTENNVAQAEPSRLPKPSAEQALVSDSDATGTGDAAGTTSKVPDRAADETADAPPDATSPAPRVVVRNAPATHPALTPAPAYTRPAPAATKAALTTTHQPGSPAPAPAAVLPAAAGPIMVQIAAVAHKEDADTLATALHKRGYAVVVRNESKDSLLHVQVGPFQTRSDAAAMKQRLLGDGYNAILKP
jgi:DedD protein